MPDTISRRTLIDELFSALRHPSMVIVVLVAAGFAYLARASMSGRDVATPLFAISGTLVALIVPAANLSAQFVDPSLNYWTGKLATGAEDPEGVVERGGEQIEQVVSVVAPLWRGFVLILISFPLSALAMFRPDASIYGFTAEHLLVGATMGLLITAVLSFLPFTWAVLHLDLARDTRRTLFTGQEAGATNGAGSLVGRDALTPNPTAREDPPAPG